MKYGLEQEFFLLDEAGIPVVVPAGCAIPCDDCGLLAEARGLPADNIVDAVYSLKAAIRKVEFAVAAFNKKMNQNYTLSTTPVMKIPKTIRVKAARTYAKGLIHYDNLYGHLTHRNAGDEMTAGIHISFTSPRTITSKDEREVCVNTMFDWVKIFTKLDREFKDEIRATKRVAGMYELKNDGRIEYRSLPANTDHDKIIAVLSQ
jgi:hypothetical protein